MSTVQRALLALYRGAARLPVMRSATGRRAFEAVYFLYKDVVEARAAVRLRRHVASGSLAIDVGANIGFFTMRFAEWVGPQGRVIAIEPEAANLESLRRRLARSAHGSRVTVVRGVAAERPGTYRLATNPHHPGDHKLSETGIEVAGHTIDALAAEHPAMAVSFIKIDVQGAELRVLRGAEAVLRRDRPALFIEIDPAALAAMGDSAEALIAALRAFGYRGRIWTPNGPGPELTGDTLAAAVARRGYVDALFVAAE